MNMRLSKHGHHIAQEASDRSRDATPHAQGGFTLLLAALVAASVLTIGAAVYAIAYEQVQLSSIGRDSQFAFYTADTAAECALFWDFRSDIASHNGLTFASSTYSQTSGKSLTQVTCDYQLAPVSISATQTAATSTFYYAPSFDGISGRCAVVTVAKYYNPSTHGINTVIHADGYSTVVFETVPNTPAVCKPINTYLVPQAVASDPNALQRTVELRY